MVPQANGEMCLDWRPARLACEIAIPIWSSDRKLVS
jgi:hypothetical protein